MKRFTRKLSVVGGCTVALLALGGFVRRKQAMPIQTMARARQPTPTWTPTGCAQNCPIVNRNQMGIAALNTLAAH